MTNKNKMLLVSIVIAVLAGGLAFFAGIKFQEERATSLRGALGANTGARQRLGIGTAGNGFRPIAGEIISADDKSITVKLTSGGSKIVLLSAATVITKNATVDKSELVAGAKVGVFGSTNSDGSVTAQDIQINPMNRTTTDNAVSK